MHGRVTAIVGGLVIAAGVAAPSALARSASIAHFSASPATLPAGGGAVRLTARVRSAKHCRFFAVQNVKGLPVTRRCRSGSAAVTITIPANAAAHSRQFAFFLEASGHGGRDKHAAFVTERSRPVQRSAPSVVTQPLAQVVAAGATVTFMAAASGSPSPAVQWQASTDGGATWTNLTGATSTILSFTASAAQNGTQYRAQFTNSQGSATTSAVGLTVETAPAVTSAPQGGSVVAGTPVTLTATASGAPVPSAQWQVSTDGGATWVSIPGATGASYLFTASSWQDGYRFRAVFTNALGQAATAPIGLAVLAQPNAAWGGYVDAGATFTAVTGTWTVPTVTCAPGETSSSAIWVGIDGAASTASDTVEQDGMSADCTSGTPSYFAWYEMFGDAAVNNGFAVNLSTSTDPVTPGDSMTATVSVLGNVWTLTVADNTAGWSFTPGPIAFTAQESSAEWIVERSTPSPLSDFGAVTFTGASATGNGVSGPVSAFQSVATQLSAGATVLASLGGLDPGGESFTETWAAAQ